MEYWIWLTLLKGIGPFMARKLLNEFSSPENIYQASYDQLIKVAGVGEVTTNIILNNKSLEAAKKILDDCNKNEINIVTCKEQDYGRIYGSHSEMPILLYYKGFIRYEPGVAVVGSRRCSAYGKMVVTEAAEYLAKNNISVISGMAKGIDGYAHTVCLNAGGYTIAFLGNGLDTCYPKEHFSLMESIIENGAVISEYPPGTKTRPEYFPRRNYLISSWSEKILVVEASKTSGALITSKIAKSQGKKILAVPSDIYSTTGQGTNQLIFDGAEIYINPKQLLLGDKSGFIEEFLKTNKDNKNDEYKQNNNSLNNRILNEIETKIISCLKDEEKTIDEIAKEINKSPFEFIEYITMLEIEGIIKSKPGGRYVL